MPHTPEPGDVLIALTNGTYGDGRRTVNLRIEDESTGKLIVDVDLTGPELTALVTCHSLNTYGYEITLSAYLGGTYNVELQVQRNSGEWVVSARISGEQFAAILGNAVTRVRGAQIGGE